MKLSRKTRIMAITAIPFFVVLYFIFSAESSNEFSISTAAGDQEDPAIYGNIIVWEDNRNGNWDIYGYNILTKEEFQITTDPGDQFNPAIYQNIVVWQDHRNGTPEIYGYNLSTFEEFQITTNQVGKYDPAVYEDIVVWRDSRKDINGYSLSTGKEFQIAVETSWLNEPEIYEDIVIWQHGHDIHGYDLSENLDIEIAPNKIYQYDPAVYEDIVVWSDNRTGSSNIHGYNLLTKKEFQVTSDPVDQYNPAIYKDIVVWEDYRNGNRDICGCNLLAKQEFFISLNASDQFDPAIYGDIVVWVDSRNGNSDIYGYNLSANPPTPSDSVSPATTEPPAIELPSSSETIELKPLWSLPSWDYIEDLVISDLDGDGIDDIVACRTHWEMEDWSVIALRGLDGKILWKFSDIYLVFRIETVDVNEDGTLDIIISGWGEGELWALDGRNGEPLWKKQLGSFISLLEVIDLEGDGKEEILIGNEGFLIVFDKKGNQIWEFLFVINHDSLEISFGHIDSDDILDIAMTDKFVLSNSHATLYVINGKNGSEIWHTTLPKFVSQSALSILGENGITVFDVDQDSRGDVIVAVDTMESSYDYHSYEILALNGQDGSKIWSTKYKWSGYLEGLTSMKTSEDTNPDILAFGDNLVLFDGKNGDKIWEVDDRSEVVEIYDIDHDGNNEVITGDGIYNSIDGEKIGGITSMFSTNLKALVISDINGDGFENIIFGSFLNGITAYEIYFPHRKGETIMPPIKFEITINSDGQQFPEIYGDIVVWQDYRNGNYDIYGYNLSTREELQITTNRNDQEMPAIYGDIVVWQDYRNGNYDIYGYNLSAREEFQITTDPDPQIDPAIYKDIVVWYDERNQKDEIYGYDISTGQEFQITKFISTKGAPAIYGDIVVWHDTRNANYDIYGYNLSTGEEFQITMNVYDQVFPVISQDSVIWSDKRNGNMDIYGYNILTEEEFRITIDPSDQEMPAIYGDVVVWQDDRNGNSDIYGYNLLAREEFQIITDLSNQFGAAIYGDIVVWHDNRSGNDDIYGFNHSIISTLTRNDEKPKDEKSGEEYEKRRDYLTEIQKLWGFIGVAMLLGIGSIIWRHFSTTLYRNESHSVLDSLFLKLHIKRFPAFSPIGNPYSPGNPIRDTSLFFGRNDILEFLENRVISSHQNSVIVLHGDPRTGKTSTLFQIENGKLEFGTEFIPVYVDMNRMTTNNDYEFFLIFSSLIQDAITLNHIKMFPIPFEERENPYLFFKDEFLKTVIDVVGKKRILFLVDEYDRIEKKVVEGKLSSDIFRFLKNVVESEGKFTFIFAGSRKIEEFKNIDEWAFISNAAEYRKISFLKQDAAVGLITKPVGENVWYTNRAVKELLILSGCHPYILQCLCFNLVILLNEMERHTFDIREVRKVERGIVENPLPHLLSMWKNLSHDQKKLASFLAGTMQRKNHSISEEKIFNTLRKHNVEFNESLSTILQQLENKDILKRKKNKYFFCIDIFRRLIAERYPFSGVLQEAEL